MFINYYVQSKKDTSGLQDVFQNGIINESAILILVWMTAGYCDCGRLVPNPPRLETNFALFCALCPFSSASVKNFLKGLWT
jgi:hypothetical protein